MIALKNLLFGKIDARNHQPCHFAVSCTKLIPDLNLAEGRNCPTGSKPKAGTFSSAIKTGFTDKRKLFISMLLLEGGTAPHPRFIFSNFEHTRQILAKKTVFVQAML
jgi:hypothetical protein